MDSAVVGYFFGDGRHGLIRSPAAEQYELIPPSTKIIEEAGAKSVAQWVGSIRSESPVITQTVPKVSLEMTEHVVMQQHAPRVAEIDSGEKLHAKNSTNKICLMVSQQISQQN